ncbi:hypothetical protein CYMTET_53749 [Cymbomonas tetramitiformis]|uniref:ShKT domain-containing protein n=1 Tax=Cymbomonas tetramitiformis TaxID=36881 RepID=A0AAE0EQA0_9CHLO|nr:hypothetical protein CYMTET_53749 [Cymbomonas tetramitiformis]
MTKGISSVDGLSERLTIAEDKASDLARRSRLAKSARFPKSAGTEKRSRVTVQAVMAVVAGLVLFYYYKHLSRGMISVTDGDLEGYSVKDGTWLEADPWMTRTHGKDQQVIGGRPRVAQRSAPSLPRSAPPSAPGKHAVATQSKEKEKEKPHKSKEKEKDTSTPKPSRRDETLSPPTPRPRRRPPPPLTAEAKSALAERELEEEAALEEGVQQTGDSEEEEEEEEKGNEEGAAESEKAQKELGELPNWIKGKKGVKATGHTGGLAGSGWSAMPRLRNGANWWDNLDEDDEEVQQREQQVEQAQPDEAATPKPRDSRAQDGADSEMMEADTNATQSAQHPGGVRSEPRATATLQQEKLRGHQDKMRQVHMAMQERNTAVQARMQHAQEQLQEQREQRVKPRAVQETRPRPTTPATEDKAESGVGEEVMRGVVKESPGREARKRCKGNVTETECKEEKPSPRIVALPKAMLKLGSDQGAGAKPQTIRDLTPEQRSWWATHSLKAATKNCAAPRTDMSKHCNLWTLRGECRNNPSFMVSNCAAACCRRRSQDRDTNRAKAANGTAAAVEPDGLAEDPPPVAEFTTAALTPSPAPQDAKTAATSAAQTQTQAQTQAQAQAFSSTTLDARRKAMKLKSQKANFIRMQGKKDSVTWRLAQEQWASSAFTSFYTGGNSSRPEWAEEAEDRGAETLGEKLGVVEEDTEEEEETESLQQEALPRGETAAEAASEQPSGTSEQWQADEERMSRAKGATDSAEAEADLPQKEGQLEEVAAESASGDAGESAGGDAGEFEEGQPPAQVSEAVTEEASTEEDSGDLQEDKRGAQEAESVAEADMGAQQEAQQQEAEAQETVGGDARGVEEGQASAQVVEAAREEAETEEDVGAVQEDVAAGEAGGFIKEAASASHSDAHDHASRQRHAVKQGRIRCAASYNVVFSTSADGADISEME